MMPSPITVHIWYRFCSGCAGLKRPGNQHISVSRSWGNPDMTIFATFATRP